MTASRSLCITEATTGSSSSCAVRSSISRIFAARGRRSLNRSTSRLHQLRSGIIQKPSSARTKPVPLTTKTADATQVTAVGNLPVDASASTGDDATKGSQSQRTSVLLRFSRSRNQRRSWRRKSSFGMAAERTPTAGRTRAAECPQNRTMGCRGVLRAQRHDPSFRGRVAVTARFQDEIEPLKRPSRALARQRPDGSGASDEVRRGTVSLMVPPEALSRHGWRGTLSTVPQATAPQTPQLSTASVFPSTGHR